MLENILDKLIKPEFRKDKEVYRKNALFIRTCLVCGLCSMFYSIYDMYIGFSYNSVINLFSLIGSIFIIIYYLKTNKLKESAMMISVFALILVWLCVYSTGGYISPLIPWLIISPIFGFLFVNRRTGVLFTVLMFISIGILYLLHKAGIKPYIDFPVLNNHLFYVLSYSGFLIMVLWIIFIIYDRGLKDYVDYQERTATDSQIKMAEITQKNAELEIAKSKAEESALAKAQFLSAMSHEIRTPMNTIIGITHLLMEENPRTEQVENIKILKFSSEGLLALINDILDFSKIDAGKIEIEEVDFNFKELINDIINSQRVRASEKNIVINSFIDQDIPEMIIGDPTRLSQILNNLIGNAVKFTQKGHVNIDALLEKFLNNRYFIKFTVIDTGIGIRKDKTDKIFDSFTQGDIDISRRFGGSGLGLAITKKLLELQNSHIYVESEEGKGSTFYFTLEFKKSNIVVHHEPKSDFVKPKFESLKGTKVLLVEDNQANQIIAEKFLTKWEIDVDIANHGLEAVEKVSNKEYDLILMDLQMPYLDGYGAAKEIRKMKSEKYKFLPITDSTFYFVVKSG